MKTRTYFFRVASLLSMAACCAGQLSAESVPIIQDDFSVATNEWDWYGDVTEGNFVLTAVNAQQYSGAQALLKSTVTIGADNQDALHIHLVVAALQEAKGGLASAEARLFLTPAPLSNPTFADPYSAPNALTIILYASGEKSMVKVSLYQKSGDVSVPGYGTPVYVAELPLDSFPLTLDWYLTLKGYALLSEPKAQTVEGSRRGFWTLGAQWEGDLRYIMRVVNILPGTAPSQLKLDEIEVGNSPLPE